MSQNVELSELDLRYEGYRMRDEAAEARPAGLDSLAWYRTAAGRSRHAARTVAVKRFPTLPLREEARHSDRTVCVAGGG